jgi:small subunit ribosomal protein S6
MNYEFVAVLEGKATEAKKKSAIEKLTKLIEGFGGKVVKMTDWGVKEFAYVIAKNTSGAFLIFELELSGEAAKNMTAKIRLEDYLIRYLLIKKDKKPATLAEKPAEKAEKSKKVEKENGKKS